MTLSAIEKLFKEHFRCAAYTAQSIVSSKQVAEDIVQNVFIKLLDTELSNIKNPVSFLYTCVRNASLDYLRNESNALRRLESVSATNDFAEVYGRNSDEFPAEDAEHLHRLHSLLQAVDQLPPKTREVVKMVYLDGNSYQETAEIMNISLSTVKAHMYQSFKMLREKIGRRQEPSAKRTLIFSLIFFPFF